MSAGLNANLTVQQLDQDFGSAAAAVINALRHCNDLFNTYWLPQGASGYQALSTAAGRSTAAADAATMGSAVTELQNLYNVMIGNATVGADGADGGNGAVTVGAAGSGHNFVTLIDRICGDSTQ